MAAVRDASAVRRARSAIVASAAARARWTGPAIAVASTIVALAALELGARMVMPPAIPALRMYRGAADVAYELQPGWRGTGPLGEHIRIDAAGLRGPEVGSGDAAVTRLLALGDSFTFGLGVEEREAWPAQLGVMLGAGVEVLNGGVPGYNLVQEARAFERRLPELAPRVVLFGLVENDLYNPTEGDVSVREDGALVAGPADWSRVVPLNPFLALPGVWRTLQVQSAAFRAASFLAIGRRLAVRGDAELAAVAARVVTADDLPSRLLRGEAGGDAAPLWDGAERTLVRIAGTAARAGVRVVVVLLPRPEQLYSRVLCGGFVRLQAAAERAGLLVVDSVPRLAAEDDRPGLYLFPRDHHPSARGHAKIATIVADAVRAGGIVSEMP